METTLLEFLICLFTGFVCFALFYKSIKWFDEI